MEKVLFIIDLLFFSVSMLIAMVIRDWDLLLTSFGFLGTLGVGFFAGYKKGKESK